MQQSHLILYAHGARDPRWAEPLARLATRIAQRNHTSKVHLAYLELMQPSLANCLASIVNDHTNAHHTNDVVRVTIVPIFIALGAHLQRDLPLQLAALREQYPAIEITVSEAIGEVDSVQESMADWVTQLIKRH